MKGILRTSVLVGAVALQATLTDNAASTPKEDKALYELRKRCAKDAADLFAQHVKDNNIRSTKQITATARNVFGYESHYSPKFNECFAILKMDSSAIEKLHHSLHTEDLWDVMAHNKIGTLWLDLGAFDTPNYGGPLFNMCVFNEKSCKQQDKSWDELIAPYMKDGTSP